MVYHRFVLMLWTCACCALADRLHDLADVDAVLDDGVADRHVLQRDLVADRDVLRALERDRPVLVQDESGQRRSGLDAFDDHDGDRIVGIVQYAMNHVGIPRK